MSYPDHASDHNDHEHNHSYADPNSCKKRRRPPVIRIVRLFAPRVFTAEPANFRTLVQKLTGKESTHDPINPSNSPGRLPESAPSQSPHNTESTIAVDADAHSDINNHPSHPADDDAVTDRLYPVDDDNITDHLYPVDVDDDQHICSTSKKLRRDDNRHDQYSNIKPSYAPAIPAEEDDHYHTDEYGEHVSSALPSILRALSRRCSSLSPRPSPRSSCSSSSGSSSPSHPIDSDLTLGHGLPGLELADQSAMEAPSQISGAAGAATSIFSSLDLISSFLMSSPTTLSPDFPDFPALLYASSLLLSPTHAL